MVLSWLILLGGLVTVALMAALVVLAYSPVAYMDHWAFIYEFCHRNMSMWHFLWKQHSEHRILFPKLFYLADLTLFGGRNIFLLISSFALQIGNLLAFTYALRRLGKFSPNVIRSAAGLAAFCLFCPVQRIDFLWEWQITFVLPFVCGTISFAAIAFHSQRNGGRFFSKWLLLAWISGLIGSYSMASGFLIWPVLLIEEIVCRLPKKVIVGTLGVACATLAVNAIGYQFMPHSDMTQLFRTPGRLISFFYVIVGYPWTGSGRPVAAILASVGILVTAGVLVHGLLKGPKVALARIFLASASCYGIGAMIIITLGRWHSGFDSRYEIAAFAFWCASGLLCLTFFESRGRLAGLIGMQLLIGIVMASSVTHIPGLVTGAKKRKLVLQMAGAALTASVNDGAFLTTLGIQPEWALDSVNFLSTHRLSFFAGRPASLLGQSLHSAYRLDSQACTGSIQGIQPISDPQRPGILVRGQVSTRPGHKAISAIAITDQDGKVVGVGSLDPQWGPNSRSGSASRENALWQGFTPNLPETRAIHAYGVLSDSSVCPLNAGGYSRVNQSLPEFDIEAPNPKMKLTRLWSPMAPVLGLAGGTVEVKNGILFIHSTSGDTQLVLQTQEDLKQFKTLVFQVRFQKSDSFELFFGRQVDGRSMTGFVPVAGEWLDIFANVALNPYWSTDASNLLRFDPTGVSGMGVTTELAGIWGSSQPIEGKTFFDFYLTKRRER